MESSSEDVKQINNETKRGRDGKTEIEKYREKRNIRVLLLFNPFSCLSLFITFSSFSSFESISYSTTKALNVLLFMAIFVSK